MLGVKSETPKTTSQGFTISFVFIRSMVPEMLPSISSERSTSKGITPHCRYKASRESLSLVKANMGEYGKFRDQWCQMSQLCAHKDGIHA
ncbi:hypothetical protein SLA2020_211040 [Shorea laevis]